MENETVNRANIVKHLIERELSMVGKTLVDTLDNDRWFFDWPMTYKQYEEFKAYAIPLLKKVFRFNSAKANSTFGFFWEHFGLRLKK